MTTAEMRPSAHGDVVHSRPVAIDFRGNPAIDPAKVVVFYGGNDGVLRAINGNRSVNIGSVTAGKEMWAFTPPEFYPQIKRLRDNNTQISFKGNPTTSPTPLPKPYGMDGCDHRLQQQLALRRHAARRTGPVCVRRIGLRPRVPDGADAEVEEGVPQPGGRYRLLHGLHRSRPDMVEPQDNEGGRVQRQRGRHREAHLIMGGGYDTCEDADVPTDACKTSGKGNGVYLLDAERAPSHGLPDRSPGDRRRLRRQRSGDRPCAVGLRGRPRWQHLPDQRRLPEPAVQRDAACRLEHHEDCVAWLRHAGALRSTESSCSCPTSWRRTARIT